MSTARKLGTGLSSLFSKSQLSSTSVDLATAAARENATTPAVSSGTATPNTTLHEHQDNGTHVKHRVRFQFPDVSIYHDQDLPFVPVSTADVSADSSTGIVDIGDQTDIVTLGQSDTASDWAKRVHVDRPSSLSSSAASRRESAPIVLKQPSEFTPAELHQYYMQLLHHEDRVPIPALANVLREAVESNAFPVAIDLSNEMLTMANTRAFVELLAVDFGLRSLKLDGCDLTDEVLKILLQSVLCLSTLSSLSLANNPKIQAQGVKYIAVFLKKSPSIRNLDISGIPLDHQGVAYLSHALSATTEKGFRQSQLQHLKMENSRFRSSHLETLESSNYPYPGISAKGIARSRLVSLSLRRNLLTHAAAKHIASFLELNATDDKFVKLCSLDLRDNEIKQGASLIAESLKGNATLQSLNLRANRIDSEGFITMMKILVSTKCKQKSADA
eukprot:jgi/Hompol1/4491/HPOL_000553-RA